MNFINFATLVKDSIVKQIGDCYTVRLNNVKKNNGIVLTGVTIMQDGSNISPTVYLNNYYEEYISQRVTFSGVVNDVINTYRQNRIPRKVDMRFFLDYKDVKPRLVYKLINAEKNKELLEDIPHMEYMDLAIVFRCLVSLEKSDASILVHNTHLKLWGVTTPQLYQDAKENTPKLLPYELKSMAEVLCDIMQTNPDQFDYDESMADFPDSIPMYVLSNKNRVEGASCMLYPNLLRDFADAAGSNLYIIPSSIHEVLLLPSVDSYEDGEIKNIIKDVNDTQVIPEEILSDSLYFYDRENDKLVML